MSDLVNLGFKADTGGLTRAQNELDKTTVAGGRLDKQNSITTRSLGLVGTAIAAVGVTASLQQIIKYTDSWSNLNTQLRQVTSSEEQLLSVREQLLQVSRETRIDLDATVGLYAEMTRGTSELNLSSDKLVGITKTLNNLFLAGGKPLSEMTGAIRQLNQGFASGVLRGDEFNSVAEGAPRIMDALSASLGKTRGELREFAATGGITSKIMVDALESYSGNAQKLADTVKLTFEQTMELVKTNVTQFVGESELIGGTVDNLGGSLLSLSQNIESTAYALGAAGAVIATAYGVKTTAAIGASITATYAKIKADGEALVAQRMLEVQTAKTTLGKLESAAAESNLALKVEAANAARLRSSIAAFDAEFALEMQRQKAQISEIGRIQSGVRMSEINASRAITTNQLTASETALSAAMARTTAAETAATASKARLGAATTAVTTATVAQTAASRALGVATSFLMGPWGILIAAVGLGAATFLTASDNIDEATASAERHAKVMSELETIYSKWGKSRLEDERNKLLARSNEILFERLEIESKIQKLSENATIQQGMETIVNPEVLSEIDDLQEKLASLNDENTNVDNGIGKVIKALDAFIVKKVESNDVINNSIDANKKLADSFNSQVLALQNQQLQLSMTADEFEIYGAIQSAIAYNATAPMTAAIIEQVKALQSQRNAITATNLELEGVMDGDLFGFGESSSGTDEFSDNLKSITDDIDSFGGAWSATGNIVVDAFGDMTDAMNDYADRMESIGKIQNKIDAAIIDAGDDKEKLAKIDIEQSKLNEEKVSAELGGYRSLADGAANLFSEKTAAARAFTAISQVLAATEIALSYQKIVASTAETGVVVANNTAQQGSNALTAITSAFAAPFPVNFAMGAAMIGIMATLLGGSFGGGGGGGGASTTGTTLGGADSESLSNANEDLEDIMIDQLAELRGLRSDLTTVDNQAYSLFKQLLGVDAGHDEIKNATEADLELSFANLNGFGGSRFGAGSYTGELRGIFDSVGEAIDESMNLLGLSATKSLKSFMFNVGKISFDDLDADDAEEKLGQILSSQSDMMTEHLIPSITQYQQVGEGAFETLVRVAKEQVTFNDAIDQMGISISNLSSSLQVDTAQNLINLVGGIDNFNDYVGEFTDEFLTDAQKLSNLENSLGDVFDSIGVGMVDSREAFYDLVSGIDLTTESGQEMLAALLEISPAMAEYIDMLEDLADDKLNLQIDLLEAQGRAEEALALSRQMELDAADKSLHLIMLRVWALEDEAEAEAAALAISNEAADLNIRLLEAQGMSEQVLALQREAELAALDESNRALLLRIYAIEDEAAAQAKAEEAAAEATAEAMAIASARSNLYIDLLNAQGRSEEALMLTRKQQLEDLDPSLRALQLQVWAEQELTTARQASEAALSQSISDMESQQSTLESAADGFRNISDAISDLIFDTYAALDSDSVSLSSAVEAARNGDFSVYGRVNSTSEIGDAVDYQSINDYIFARDVAFNKLAEIRDLSLSAENVTENAIKAIDTNISQMTVDMFAQSESLESINSSNANIDNGVLELVNTMKAEKESAEMAAIELKSLLENLNRESVAANKTLKRIEQNTYEVIE